MVVVVEMVVDVVVVQVEVIVKSIQVIVVVMSVQVVVADTGVTGEGGSGGGVLTSCTGLPHATVLSSYLLVSLCGVQR